MTIGAEEVYDDGPLYEAAKKVYPQKVWGTYRRLKWIVLWVALGVYYIIPFIRWNRGPNLPDQAVLADIAHSRFYFFFIQIWPQEVYYFTGLLIIAALVLFLSNALFGRVWCGYACPQTVWTDLFFWVERDIEGDRRDRMKLDGEPWTADKIMKRRRQARDLAPDRARHRRGGDALFRRRADAAQGVLHPPGADRRLHLGRHPDLHHLCARRLHARAGLPLHVPVAAHPGGADRQRRAQRHLRGGPGRAAHVGQGRRAGAGTPCKPAGDCVDCLQCIAVCPTGIDIRKGPQLGCINCGLCIDACDAVMTKIKRPTRLIAYDTDENRERR